MCLGSGAAIDAKCNSASDGQKDLPFMSSASPPNKRRLHDDRRAPVDHGVPDSTRFVVIGIVSSQYAAFDRALLLAIASLGCIAMCLPPDSFVAVSTVAETHWAAKTRLRCRVQSR
jgi:hypothetical protein